MKFICRKCGRTYEENDKVWRCECGGYLSLEQRGIIRKEDIHADRFSMWRYDTAYPMKYEDLKVSFDEGMTPLVRAPFDGCALRIKMETLMPTGSFKDRGTVMVVNWLINHGVIHITEDSSGNAGASVAGYCALAGVDCDIYVPANTSAGKLTQMEYYGAHVHRIEGNREAVAEAAQEDSASYAGHNWHPLFVEGTKSAAYELWEQNGFEAPENIVAVAGNGSTILGLYYGFRDLLDCGQVTRMPHLYAVQAANCNPMYREYAGIRSDEPFRATVAEGIALAQPNKGSDVVHAVRDTGGEVLSVSEEEILSATDAVSAMGFFAEPTSCTAFAGIRQLISRKVLNPSSDTVMMLSGNGLKASAEMAERKGRGE